MCVHKLNITYPSLSKSAIKSFAYIQQYKSNLSTLDVVKLQLHFCIFNKTNLAYLK